MNNGQWQSSDQLVASSSATQQRVYQTHEWHTLKASSITCTLPAVYSLAAGPLPLCVHHDDHHAYNIARPSSAARCLLHEIPTKRSHSHAIVLSIMPVDAVVRSITFSLSQVGHNGHMDDNMSINSRASLQPKPNTVLAALDTCMHVVHRTHSP